MLYLGAVRGLIAMMLVFAVLPSQSANAETRKLKLYFLHTGEKAEITFKKNGRYVRGGLKKINHFLRDWRRNEPTKMNPRLLDLIWEVYKETRSRKHIHVISAYRSPATNSLLRKRGRGVAKKSQHTLGNALDFFIPGVSLTKLRNIGLRKGIGGVGFYPKSGSPFVHMDTGRVRHWPRMNRKQLVKVFPRGKTLHVPSDGKPLPGYNIAKANYERNLKGLGKPRIASAEEIEKKPSILAKLFSRNDDNDEGAIGATSAPKAVQTKKVTPAKPVPTVETPAPAPAVVEPIDTPETVLAALTPNQIPVPITAPRIAIVKPPEPELEPVQVVETTEVASLEPVEEDTQLEEQVAFAIPVPAPRPKVEVETVPVLAIAEPVPTAKPSVEVAALSANEISSLREQVYATLENDAQNNVPSNVPFKPATQVAESIPFQPPTQLTQSDVPSLIQSASSAIDQQITSVEPIEPELQASGGVAIPVTKPHTAPQLVTALLPSEPSANNTNKSIVPSQLPETDIAETVEQTVTAAINVPVPQPALRPTNVSPVVQTSKPTPKAVVKTPVKAKAKELTLTEFKTANLEERLTGKWALATDASIKDIADIQPPAYGQNIIRELPTTVLSSGFSQNQIGSATGFSGSSVEFLDFKKFK